MGSEMCIRDRPYDLDVHITAEPAFEAIRAPTKPLAASAFPSPALSHDSPFLEVPRPVLAGVITGLAKQDLVRLCSVARRALQLRPLAKQVDWELGDHFAERPLCALCGYTIGGILSWKLHFGSGSFLHYGCGQQAGCLLPPPVAPPSSLPSWQPLRPDLTLFSPSAFSAVSGGSIAPGRTECRPRRYERCQHCRRFFLTMQVMSVCDECGLFPMHEVCR